MNGDLYEIRCSQHFDKTSCPFILRRQWSCGECTAAVFLKRIKKEKPVDEEQSSGDVENQEENYSDV